MVTRDLTTKKVMLCLFKDFASTHTITTLARKLNLTRVGIWKILKKFEVNKYILLKAVGRGKTSTCIITLNWENLLIEKMLSLYLTEEAIKQRLWQVNFNELERIVDFIILYGSILHLPQQANDIDIICVAPKKNFLKIQGIIDQVQKTQAKKIHSINFVKNEFRTELKKQNKAFIDAIKNGIILFGQENFVKFVRGL